MKGAYPVQISRGCNFSCDYCSTRRFTGGAGFRPRPIEDVVEEIKALKAKRIFFMDDNIFADYDHAKALNPDMWSYSWKLQLPGYADELIVDNGTLAADLTIEEARERFLVNDRVARYIDDPDFSIRIRQ